MCWTGCCAHITGECCGFTAIKPIYKGCFKAIKCTNRKGVTCTYKAADFKAFRQRWRLGSGLKPVASGEPL